MLNKFRFILIILVIFCFFPVFSDVSTGQEELSVKEKEIIQNINKNIGFNKDDYAQKLHKYLEENENSSKKEEPAKKLSTFDYMVKTSFSLGVVLFIMLTLAWIYSRMKGITPNTSLLLNKFNNTKYNKIKILATSPLGQGKIIHLIDVNGKQLVIGSTNNNINLLSEIKPDEIEAFKAKIEEESLESDDSSENE